jgi:hypothetical protein
MFYNKDKSKGAKKSKVKRIDHLGGGCRHSRAKI